jgi:SSS family solute:Na+ symporter
MSTASACLLASSTVLLEDVYLPLRGARGTGSVRQSRAVTLALGLVMTVLACVMNDVIAALTVAYDFLVGGLLAPLLGAMLWRGGTSAGALTSIAVGGTLVAVLLAWAGLDSDAPIYVGLAGSALSYILVSLLSRR